MADDFLACTDCGATTDVTAESLYESMGRTKKGTWRKRRGWMKALHRVVAEWLCNDCLTRAEEGHQCPE